MTHLDERQALLQSILDEPERDDVRLVYADHLDEYGDESDRARAEFIRVQIRLTAPDLSCNRWMYSCGENIPTIARLAKEGCSRCRLYASLRLREGRLFQSWDATGDLGDTLGLPGGKSFNGWNVKVPERTTFEIRDDQDGPARLSFRWQRGFVSSIRAPLQALLEHGPAILKAHPVERMEATDRKPMRFDGDSVGAWRWHRSESAIAVESASHFLPLDFSDVGGEVVESVCARCHRFASEQATLEALHAFTLAHCRNLAHKGA